MAAIAENRELHARRAPVVEEGVDSGANGPAGEQDVVDEDDRSPGEVKVEVRGVHLWLRVGTTTADVVAVEGDVDVADRDLGAALLADERVQALRKKRTASVDANQGKAFGPRVALGDLV